MVQPRPLSVFLTRLTDFRVWVQACTESTGWLSFSFGYRYTSGLTKLRVWVQVCRVHREGPIWKYVRASMTVIGYLPTIEVPNPKRQSGPNRPSSFDCERISKVVDIQCVEQQLFLILQIESESLQREEDRQRGRERRREGERGRGREGTEVKERSISEPA